MAEDANEGLSIRCPECNRRLKVPAKMAGKRVPCPACKAMLNLPTFESDRPQSGPAAPSKNLDSHLDDIGFKLADELPKGRMTVDFAAEQLGLHQAELKEKEFSYPCKVCGSMMYARPADVGSMTRCPDCYSEFSIPSPPVQKARPRDPDLSKIADVSLMPPQGRGLNSSEFGRATAEDYLAKAAKEIDDSDEDKREQLYDFDSATWLKRTFAFLGDPSLIVVAITTGLFMGGTLLAASVVSQMAAEWKPNSAESARKYGLITVLLLFGAPLLAITLANGVAVLEASANKLKRIANWPIFNPSDAIGEIAVVLAAFLISIVPGGILSWLGSWVEMNPDIRMGIVMLSAYLLYPIILLGMLDNQSVGEPYSQAVIGSMGSRSNAWGGMYLITGLAMALIFVLYLFAAVGTEVPKFVFGLFLPILVFFIFHQFGVLGSRIADVTDLAFETEESDDSKATTDEKSD